MSCEDWEEEPAPSSSWARSGGSRGDFLPNQPSTRGSEGQEIDAILITSVRTRLTRVVDGSEIHVQTFTYDSKKRQFIEWAGDDAKAVREELDQAAATLSTQIVDKLFSWRGVRA